MSVVGIDLGTTNSAVAIVNNRGLVDIVNNDIGKQTTPSVVSFRENGNIIVGESAKEQLFMYPTDTIFAIKRLIGYNYDDNEIEEEKKNYLYEIAKGTRENAGKAVVKVNFERERREYTPEEISTYILTKLKISASRELAKPVEKAVITVPAYFSSSQRKLTKLAGTAAGLNVLGIISEPTAAAIAYSYKNIGKTGTKNVFVFDFGGETLDCTLMEVKNNNYNVIATSGNMHLGGEDIDMVLLRYAAEKFKKWEGIDIMQKEYQRERLKLKLECEQVKIKLSADGVVCERIFFDNFVNRKALDVTVTKDEFEYMIDDILDHLREPLEEVFEEASEKLKKDIDPTKFVDEVIMVGGSTHIPKVTEILNDFFGKDPIFGVNPDTAVAQGAAIYAASLTGRTSFRASEDVKNASRPGSGEIRLVDVIPLSIGTDIKGDIFSEIFKHNTAVPCKETKTYETVYDYQTALRIDIYEGLREVASENRNLVSCDIIGLTPRLKGETKVEVTFSITSKNILEISAKEIGGSASNSLNLYYNFNEISEEEVERIKQRAREFQKSDAEIIETSKAFIKLDDLIYEVKKKSSDSDVSKIINEMESWKSNNSSKHSKEVYAQIDQFKKELRPHGIYV